MAQPNKQPSPQEAAKAQPKILRIGVIQAGKIVEERLIRRRENVTIGASPRNNIVVPASTLPRSFVLFEMSGGNYFLSLTDTMDGRVSVGQKVMSLEQVRSEGHAKSAGKGRLRLELSDSSRGKVLLGEVTLLFQFVAPPPVQPRPQLPPSVRGGLVGQMDWLFASSFGGSAVAIAAFLLILGSMEIPIEAAPDVVPDDFASFVPVVQRPKPKVPKLDVKKLAGEGEKKVAKAEGPKRPVKATKRRSSKGKQGDKTPKKAGKPCDEACQAARAAARRARLQAQVAKMGALKILGAKGQGQGTTQNLLSGGDPGTSADKAFKGVGGVTTSGRGGGSGLRGKGAGGTGKTVGIGDLGGRVGGPGKVATGGRVIEKVPVAKIKQTGRTKIEGTLKPSAVASVLRRGMRALKACYQRALKRNPKLAGKISVILTINSTGKVTRVEIDQDTIGDSSVASCIKSYCRRWRFPPPTDGDTVDVSFAVGFQSSQ